MTGTHDGNRDKKRRWKKGEDEDEDESQSNRFDGGVGKKRQLQFSPEEDDLIFRLYALLGNRWELIAGRLPERTGEEVESHWNSNLKNRHERIHEASSSLSSRFSRPSRSRLRNPGASMESGGDQKSGDQEGDSFQSEEDVTDSPPPPSP